MKLIDKVFVKLGALTGLLAMLSVSAAAHAREVPNIVWIIADDLGPELACYGYPDVATPNLDQLAREGTRYSHAFATSPVCSSSRTAFQSGLYQTSIGGHHHLTRNKPVLSKNVPTVTGLMQSAGYFVSNGRGIPNDSRLAKSGFNFVYNAREFFDGTDWSERPEGQPFFAQVQISQPHRPFVKSVRARPKAPIPPYYPVDSAVTKADWANYLASIEVLDQKVGKVVARLRAEGVLEETLIIFFGDHGRPHVRGKQWLYDGGLHVPLLVRWPEHVQAGAVDHRLVSLLDLMPTSLTAAGIAVPDLPGGNLLDSNWLGHSKLYAARDRCGDAVDRIRSIRTREFKYIRNFHPELPYLQHSGYKKLQYPVLTLMKVMKQDGRWDSPFMADRKPSEELYDLVADPFEMHNLAADSSFEKTLAKFRADLEQWVEVSGDQGRVEEGDTVDMGALREEKWRYYENGMKRRGLDPALSDSAYLDWWKTELDLK